MEEVYSDVRLLQRDLNTLEHMIYVSCKFTKTTEMLQKVMEQMVATYEHFFGIAYQVLLSEDSTISDMPNKIQFLTQVLVERGIVADLSEYYLLKKLLISDFETMGEYRRNLSIIAFLDGEEYVITIAKLLDFYENIKRASSCLTQGQF
ncbi:MAG: hypothetical protein ACLFPL_03455 [Candidatus Nanoarchaeia archaeon]